MTKLFYGGVRKFIVALWVVAVVTFAFAACDSYKGVDAGGRDDYGAWTIIDTNNAVTVYCTPWGDVVYIDQKDNQDIAALDGDPTTTPCY